MKKIIIVLLFLLVGCNDQTNYTWQQHGKQMEQTKIEKLLKKHHVAEAHVVQFEDELLVATQIEPFRRFEKKKIEKKLKKEIEKELAVEKVFVSTDYKIFIELKKLNKLSKKEVERITSLAEEET